MSESLNSDQQQQLLFMMLLQQHEQIAMMGMGKLKSPVTDTIERDMKSAKYAIDTLVMLEKFTSGNLSKELSGYLTQMLTNLRMNFADEKKKESAGAPKTGEGPKTEGNPKREESFKSEVNPTKEEGQKKADSSTNGDNSEKENPKKVGSPKSEIGSKNARPDNSGEDNPKEEKK